MSNRYCCFLFVLCLMIPSTAHALARPEQIPPPSPALIYSPKNTDILIFQGTIEKAANGTALRTQSSVYPLIGGDFAMIVGEHVKVIGRVVQENAEPKILVARVQFQRLPQPPSSPSQ